jgi:hypothetical protein
MEIFSGITLLELEIHPSLVNFLVPCLRSAKSPKTRVHTMHRSTGRGQIARGTRGIEEEEGLYHGGAHGGGRAAAGEARRRQLAAEKSSPACLLSSVCLGLLAGGCVCGSWSLGSARPINLADTWLQTAS